MTDPALPVFELLAPHHWTAPVVFSSPHSGSHLPTAFMAQSCLTQDQLHLSEDTHIDALFSSCLGLGMPLMRSTYSRSYIDLNREPFELDQRMFLERLPGYMNTTSPRVACGLGTIPRTVGDGHLIYQGHLALADALQRVEQVYKPYHRNLAALLAEAHAATGFVLLVDCHSMPSSAVDAPHEATGLGQIDAVIGDRYGSSCDPVLADAVEACLCRHGLNVTRNKPYAGGFITETHGQPKLGKHALQIEINRAIYMDETTRQPNAGYHALKATLDELVATLAGLAMDMSGAAALPVAAE